MLLLLLLKVLASNMVQTAGAPRGLFVALHLPEGREKRVAFLAHVAQALVGLPQPLLEQLQPQAIVLVRPLLRL